MDFKGTNVLLIGLGILGGGVSIANWLIGEGAEVTVSDAKSAAELADSVRQVRVPARFVFGACPDAVVEGADVVVVNQAVPPTNREVVLAEKLGKPVLNESNIFYDRCTKPIVAITGTRGKTTTATWTAHLFGPAAIMAGNSSAAPLLKMLPAAAAPSCAVVINEIPSFQLERFRHAPAVAVITNIFVDHLNRHGTLENYARTKGRIFARQGADDTLILNADNEWTDLFLAERPQARTLFFSLARLPAGKDGIFFDRGSLVFRAGGTEEKMFDAASFAAERGAHNLANLMAAILAAHAAGAPMADIVRRIPTVPDVRFRQERIIDTGRLVVVNDTAATSPEGGAAAIRRFGSPACILIAGGTDADLAYDAWADAAAERLPPGHIILLAGSATTKMLAALSGRIDASRIAVEETLAACVDRACALAAALSPRGKVAVVFSPAAKSFEKFKNEFDRGEQFAALARERFRA